MPRPLDTPEDIWASRSHPVREDMRFQRASWEAERAGWFLMALFVALSFFGLFSVGPLSTAAAVDDVGTLKVEYQRFLRNGASIAMTVRVGNTRLPAVLTIGNSLSESFQIETITPSPSAEKATPEGLELTFDTANAPVEVHFTLRPDTVGWIESDIGLAGAAPVRISQFVFP